MSLPATQPNSNHSLEVLPHELFEQLILPDLLSQHLHALLVNRDPPTWHAFHVLPLVSRSFYKTCDSLVSKMFGTKRRFDEGGSPTPDQHEDLDEFDGFDDFEDPEDYDPSPMLNYAILVWDRARHRGLQTAFSHTHSRSDLLKSGTLVRVYTCLALGKIFLNANVMQPLGLPPFGGETDYRSYVKKVACRGRRTAWDEDYEEQSYEQPEPTDMDEAEIHKCFMPFECAQLLCDSIAPTRLACVAAEYMAQMLPLYYALPLVAKCTSDLEFNVLRQYKLGLDEYTEFAVGTLHRLENEERLLEELMSSGTLVRSFWGEGGIPLEVMKITGIINALDEVRKADWGAETVSTRSKAVALIRRWTA